MNISGRCHRSIWSVLRTAARHECVPLTFDAGVVSLQLMKGLAMSRTIKHMNPPPAVPHVTGADAQSEFSVTLGTSFHRYTRHWRFCFLVAFPVVWDLLLCAKDLFVAARTVRHGLQGIMRRAQIRLPAKAKACDVCANAAFRISTLHRSCLHDVI